VICAEQPPEAMAAIEVQARRLCAPLHSAGQEWHVNVERGRLVYQDDRGLIDLAAPKLFGRHQFDNAGLAIATLRAQDAFRIEPAAFEPASSMPNGRRGCSVWRRAGLPRRGRKAAKSGSMAGTMPRVGASPRQPWAISRNVYRGRWWSSSA